MDTLQENWQATCIACNRRKRLQKTKDGQTLTLKQTMQPKTEQRNNTTVLLHEFP